MILHGVFAVFCVFAVFSEMLFFFASIAEYFSVRAVLM